MSSPGTRNGRVKDEDDHIQFGESGTYLAWRRQPRWVYAACNNLRLAHGDFSS